MDIITIPTPENLSGYSSQLTEIFQKITDVISSIYSGQFSLASTGVSDVEANPPLDQSQFPPTSSTQSDKEGLSTEPGNKDGPPASLNTEEEVFLDAEDLQSHPEGLDNLQPLTPGVEKLNTDAVDAPVDTRALGPNNTLEAVIPLDDPVDAVPDRNQSFKADRVGTDAPDLTERGGLSSLNTGYASSMLSSILNSIDGLNRWVAGLDHRLSALELTSSAKETISGREDDTLTTGIPVDEDVVDRKVLDEETNEAVMSGALPVETVDAVKQIPIVPRTVFPADPDNEEHYQRRRAARQALENTVIPNK
jgi:hypothetical protein